MPVISKYDIEARYAPALVCSVPFALVTYYYLADIDTPFWSSVLGMSTGNLSLTAALFIVVVNLCRGLGKFIEEKAFNAGLSFPTTEFLLDNSTELSSQFKQNIIGKLEYKFGVRLGSPLSGDMQNRRAIHEAVGQIRRSLYKKSDLLLVRNIQFGVAKNLVGGSLIAGVVSTIAVIISYSSSNEVALKISAALLVTYVILGMSSFLLMKFTAKHYAHTLFDEFNSAD